MSAGDRRKALNGPPSYQIADVRYMALVEHALNANHPGLGKTIETIGAIFEAETVGPTLICAPKTSLEIVWEAELKQWQPHPVLLASGFGMGRKKREFALAEAMDALESGMPFFLIVNPDMIRYAKEMTGDDPSDKESFIFHSQYKFLHETEWYNIVLDEVHKGAVRHTNTMTAKGMFDLKLVEGGKRMALSGTPMGGKPINLWGVLHYLDPDRFANKYVWVDQWLDRTPDGYSKMGTVGGVKKAREDEFFKELRMTLLRRTKEEAAPWLPPKQRIPVWVDMTPKQSAQYKEFARMAAVVINDASVSATSILAEFTRLKQFAGAYQDATHLGDGKFKLKAQPDSGKLDALIEKLDELGIIDGDTDEQVVIFSQFAEMCHMVYDALVARGVKCLQIAGGGSSKEGQRTEMMRSFQQGEAQAFIMTTQSGGVAIELDRANTVFILDEWWDPDMQEQAEDRVHRASRIHQVTVYYLRTAGTVEQYIKEMTDAKGAVNNWVLDEGRRLKLFDTARDD
jgi:SNF2 family DNA or RNA helicase